MRYFFYGLILILFNLHSVYANREYDSKLNTTFQKTTFFIEGSVKFNSNQELLSKNYTTNTLIYPVIGGQFIFNDAYNTAYISGKLLPQFKYIDSEYAPFELSGDLNARIKNTFNEKVALSSYAIYNEFGANDHFFFIALNPEITFALNDSHAIKVSFSPHYTQSYLNLLKPELELPLNLTYGITYDQAEFKFNTTSSFNIINLCDKTCLPNQTSIFNYMVSPYFNTKIKFSEKLTTHMDIGYEYYKDRQSEKNASLAYWFIVGGFNYTPSQIFKANLDLGYRYNSFYSEGSFVMNLTQKTIWSFYHTTHFTNLNQFFIVPFYEPNKIPVYSSNLNDIEKESTLPATLAIINNFYVYDNYKGFSLQRKIGSQLSTQINQENQFNFHTDLYNLKKQDNDYFSFLNIGANYQHSLSRNLNLTFGLNYARQIIVSTFEQPDYDYIILNTGFKYNFSQSVFVGTDYEFTIQNQSNTSFRHLIKAYIRYNF